MPPAVAKRPDLIAALVIFVSTLFWLWFSTRHDLLQDEAYYWQWSRHLAAGYYDGPPLVAFVIKAGTAVFGNTELGVRCGAVICAALAAWFLYKLAAEIFGPAVGLTAVAIAVVNPLFGGGATLMTLDPVQLCFWMLCAWVTWRAVSPSPASRVLLPDIREAKEEIPNAPSTSGTQTSTSSGPPLLGRTGAWGFWLLAGMLAGLTAMSKLNGLLILPSVLLYCIVEPSARVWLRKPQPYAAAAIALAVFAPFVWWNHEHGNAFWIHINAMGSRTDQSHAHFTLKYLGEFLGAQLGLISPLLFLTYVWMLVRPLTLRPLTPMNGGTMSPLAPVNGGTMSPLAPVNGGTMGPLAPVNGGTMDPSAPATTATGSPSAPIMGDQTAAQPALDRQIAGGDACATDLSPNPWPRGKGYGSGRPSGLETSFPFGEGGRQAGWVSGLRYCWSLSVVVFVATTLLSLKSRVEANWAVAAYLTGFILVACAIVAGWQRGVAAKSWHVASVAVAAVMTALLYASTLSASAPHIAALDKRTNELYGWRDMARRVEAERIGMGGDPFVFGINYRIPSELAFYLPGRPQTYSLFLHDRASEYLFWEDERKLIGRDAVMVNDADTPDHLDDARAVFTRIEVARPLQIYRAPYKKPIRTIQIFRCYGFKGYRRVDWQAGW